MLSPLVYPFVLFFCLLGVIFIWSHLLFYFTALHHLPSGKCLRALKRIREDQKKKSNKNTKKKRKEGEKTKRNKNKNTTYCHCGDSFILSCFLRGGEEKIK